MDNLVELNLLVEKYVADEVSQKGLAEIALRQANARFREIAKASVHVGGNEASEIAKNALAELKDTFTRESYTLRQIQNRTRSVEKHIKKATNSISKIDQTTRSMAMQVDRLFDSTNLIKNVSFINTGVGLANIAIDVAGFQLIDYRLNEVVEQLQRQSQALVSAERRDENNKSGKCLNLCRLYTQIMNRVNDNDTIDYYDIETAIREYESFIHEMILNLTQHDD